MAQMAKNPPAMQKTQVRSLGQEDPLEKGIATQFNILTWRKVIPPTLAAFNLVFPEVEVRRGIPYYWINTSEGHNPGSQTHGV